MSSLAHAEKFGLIVLNFRFQGHQSALRKNPETAFAGLQLPHAIADHGGMWLPQAVRSYAFPILLLFMPVLAWLLPGPGAPDGLLRPSLAVPAALFLVFLASGLTLRTETIIAGLANWRVHLFVHVFLFAIGPVLALLLLTIAGGGMEPNLRLGIFYLAALPCTISTAVVYTTAAGGNQMVALFNATVSNVLGVVLVPLLIATQLSIGGLDAGLLAGMIRNTALLVFPPLILGQVLRQFVKPIVERRRGLLAGLSSAMILFITYTAFCRTFQEGLLGGLSFGELARAGLLVTGLMGFLFLLAGAGILLMRFNRADALAAFFCSTLKTLGAGLPLAQAVFKGTEVEVGIVILPLIAYFLPSLVIGAVLAQRLRR